MVSGRVFLGGHSYGGRQGTLLAATTPGLADGLLLLSYPLHPPKRATELRTAHFPSLQTPALFVSGTRDGFGAIEELTAALKQIPARTRLLPIEGAGHELMNKRNAAEVPGVVKLAFGEMFASTAASTAEG
jgi:predicted alpha/beta-hydrolase family hydrolase